MTAFYEWVQTNKPKQPYAFGREDQQPLAMAGLWESWKLTKGPAALLQPAADDVLTRWKVSSRVNSVWNNGADLLEEVD